jgi:ribonuclease HI
MAPAAAILGQAGGGLCYGDTEKELSGFEPETTNNRMELMGAIMALEALTRSSHVKLHTDSQYVQKGVSEWLEGWIRRGWKTADKKPVKNADLWQRLQKAIQPHQVEFIWVRGHNGHADNERVDRLAVAAIERQRGG